MSVATSLSEAPPRSSGAEVVALRRTAVTGEAALGVRADNGVTRLVELHQRDPLSLRLPQPGRGDIFEASLITTSGGVVGGDSLKVEVTAGAGSALRVYPQAAEKVYRSLGADSRIAVGLTAAAGAWLEWLPQETILFDGARLRRDTNVELASWATPWRCGAATAPSGRRRGRGWPGCRRRCRGSGMCRRKAEWVREVEA